LNSVPKERELDPKKKKGRKLLAQEGPDGPRIGERGRMPYEKKKKGETPLRKLG